MGCGEDHQAMKIIAKRDCLKVLLLLCHFKFHSIVLYQAVRKEY